MSVSYLKILKLVMICLKLKIFSSILSFSSLLLMKTLLDSFYVFSINRSDAQNYHENNGGEGSYSLPPQITSSGLSIFNLLEISEFLDLVVCFVRTDSRVLWFLINCIQSCLVSEITPKIARFARVLRVCRLDLGFGYIFLGSTCV